MVVMVAVTVMIDERMVMAAVKLAVDERIVLLHRSVI